MQAKQERKETSSKGYAPLLYSFLFFLELRSWVTRGSFSDGVVSRGRGMSACVWKDCRRSVKMRRNILVLLGREDKDKESAKRVRERCLVTTDVVEE